MPAERRAAGALVLGAPSRGGTEPRRRHLPRVPSPHRLRSAPLPPGAPSAAHRGQGILLLLCPRAALSSARINPARTPLSHRHAASRPGALRRLRAPTGGGKSLRERRPRRHRAVVPAPFMPAPAAREPARPRDPERRGRRALRTHRRRRLPRPPAA